MKKILVFLHLGPIPFLFLISILLGSCCNRIHNSVDKDSFVLVLLEDDLQEDYMLKNYDDFHLQSAKRSSKSQNQYQCRFSITEKQKEKLTTKLTADEHVLSFDLLEVIDSEAINSTNTKFNKTSPIKK